MSSKRDACRYITVANILQKAVYAGYDTTAGTPTVTTYTYGDDAWGDLLTAYGGGNITYDAIGNPLTWYDGRTFTWQRGRQLASTAKNGVSISYAYNADGMRIGKTVGTDTTEYVYDGGKLIAQKMGNNAIVWRLDASGKYVGFEYGGETYLYMRNVQGDIVGIRTESAVVARYTYDAWGKVLSVTDAGGTPITDPTHVAHVNPIRYRDYYYDTETSLYYVSSRYYDPEIGRWINADNQLSTGDMTGINLFTYCGNNPVNRIDPTGEAWWHWAIGAVVVAACAVATVVTCGGFAAAAGAVAAVGTGVAAATTASTVAAGAFIGSATVYGMAVLSAASTSSSVQEFNDQGNWDTVVATAAGAVVGGAVASSLPPKQSSTTYPPNDGFNATPRESVLDTGSQLQRVGGTSGTFVAPINTPLSSLSLPPDKIGAPVMNLEVLRPISVQAGTAMPWFGQPGGGTQFLLPDTIQNLIQNGSLRIMP